MNRFTKVILILGLFAISACSSPEAENTAVEEGLKIITNAKIWTGNDAQPWAEVVVVKDERIVAVGGAELEGLHAGAEKIDAGGNLMLPGFIDNHTHFMDGSASLLGIRTQSTKSSQEFIDTVRDYAATSPEGEWIVGGLWDHEAWEGNLPHKDWIDQYTQDKPLFLLRTDGHMAIANSVVLEIAGITKDTPDPEGGTIVRDEDGEPFLKITP